MDKMVVVAFDSERQAYEGVRILKELHAEGSITLYGDAVIAKDANGTVAVREAADSGPLGTAVGMLTGGLVGMLGGPVGVAVGAAAGTVSGSVFDITQLGIDSDFVDEVASHLKPGTAAVIAEIQEEWILPLDTRMEAAGGVVFRRTRDDFVDDMIERDITTTEAEIAALRAEHAQARAEDKAKLQAKIDAAQSRLQGTRERARTRAEATRREGEAKTAALREQAATARAERKQQLDKRTAEIQAHYKERSAKLHESWQHTKEALTP
jgi:uncharacterized membrane protein